MLIHVHINDLLWTQPATTASSVALLCFQVSTTYHNISDFNILSRSDCFIVKWDSFTWKSSWINTNVSVKKFSRVSAIGYHCVFEIILIWQTLYHTDRTLRQDNTDCTWVYLLHSYALYFSCIFDYYSLISESTFLKNKPEAHSKSGVSGVLFDYG